LASNKLALYQPIDGREEVLAVVEDLLEAAEQLRQLQVTLSLRSPFTTVTKQG